MSEPSEYFTLYSDRAETLLRQSLEFAESQKEKDLPSRLASTFLSRYADSSDEDGGASSSEESNESEGEKNTAAKQSEVGSQESLERIRKESSIVDRRGQETRPEVIKTVKTLVHSSLQVDEEDTERIYFSASLLSKNERLTEDWVSNHRVMFEVAHALGKESKKVLVIALRSGKLAAGIFQKNKCLAHRTSSRYTVRKGQGKAQSTQDGSRRPKSMGSQLRRAGEQMLKEDIAKMTQDWKNHIEDCSLIFISAPKPMQKSLYDSAADVFSKDDSRIRRVPFDSGKPTFESVCMIYDVVMTLYLGKKIEEADPNLVEEPTTIVNAMGESKETETDNRDEKKVIDIPLTPIHEAIRDGEYERALALAKENPSEVNLKAGDSLSTPLHFAARNKANIDTEKVSDLIFSLLVEGGANPCILDVRDRPPYFLCEHDKTREAFRRARAQLGEEYCAWDKEAKVGPPLTEEDIANKKLKEAEKRKRKKARQKAAKAREKEEEVQEQKNAEEEEKRQQEEAEANRIRDGLQPKADPSTNACDFCQKPCRRRTKMFTRLDYAYCSMECVNNHKRELTAKAAMARFGNS